MEQEGPGRLERALLLHLLDHRGQQVRFEADQWTTEFGILRAFVQEDSQDLKTALRALEMARYVYRRVQYVIGYSEPKLVYSLTPSGHRMALDLRREETDPRHPQGAPNLLASVVYSSNDAIAFPRESPTPPDA